MTKPSKSVRILDAIDELGAAGMRLTDIQRALWAMTYPKKPFTRALRGYWCTNLLGGPHYHEGLLHAFCEKDPETGRWVRNCIDHDGHPWRRMRELSESHAGRPCYCFYCRGSRR